MKKILIPAIIFIACYSQSHAQNTFPATGNVGIGTTEPAAVLTVTNATPVIQLFDKDVNQLTSVKKGIKK